jgi:hypothetical protein
MQATIKTYGRGSFATQSDVFTIPLALAVEVVKHLDCRIGCYWESAAKAVRRAKRSKLTEVKLYTAGFGSDDLVGAINAAGGTTICLPD